MIKLFSHLLMDVINPGFCIRCGACVASCPVKVLDLKPLPQLTGTCINCGICYGTCPEVVRPEVYQLAVFGSPERDEDLGTFSMALSASASDQGVRSRAQDGGAVTSFLAALLESNYIDGAVLVGTGEKPWLPVVRVITDPKEVVTCSGSKYSHAPIFTGVRDAVDFYRRDKLAVVGTPCQILACRRMMLSEPTNRHLIEAVKLTLGLFCWGVFDYERFFVGHVERAHAPLSEITKFDIRDGRISIQVKRENPIIIPLDSVREHLDFPCSICPDFTAKLADISFGAEGSPEGMTTVLLRTHEGLEAFEIAARSGMLAWSELGDSISAVKSAAALKRKRAEENLKAMKDAKRALPVWALEPESKNP
jgi:coenzyme F420-reducing hydrogenase beta subunit